MPDAEPILPCQVPKSRNHWRSCRICGTPPYPETDWPFSGSLGCHEFPRMDDSMRTSPNPRSTARIGGHPLHVLLVPIPFTCFIGTLVTDIAYAKTANMQWAN